MFWTILYFEIKVLWLKTEKIIKNVVEVGHLNHPAFYVNLKFEFIEEVVA